MAGEVSFVYLAVIAVLATCTGIVVSFLIVFTFHQSHLLFGHAGPQPGDMETPLEPIHGEVEGKAGGGGGREMIGYCGWQSLEGT
ncbi:hypothetical protein HPP92_026798 [Vanilla planifolia]|uniref:Uncharacterized protein n=1 Tax=Vanilla planifolia TaxID=51239 RepID=A0A835PHD7_VANPL|nr:hypothetical protein HPP92_026798 [Vanilla planifolia]KAG0473541.1 hypothetical protein HPP92_015398 [Vanilla planifolia]